MEDPPPEQKRSELVCVGGGKKRKVRKKEKAQTPEVTRINGASFCVWAADRVIVVPRQDKGQEVRGELWCDCIH